MANIKIKKPWELAESQATHERAFWSRRKFLQSMGMGGMALGSGMTSGAVLIPGRQHPTQGVVSTITPPDSLASHHNFVEFSQWSGEIPRLAQSLDTQSWPITIDGLVERPITLEAAELSRLMQREQRTCRFRCIEGWAMVVPWSGFPLNKLIALVQPQSQARYIRFDSFYEPQLAPAQQLNDWHVWPYTEVLSMSEAMHDLTFMATGAYGKDLPKEQGAPLRLVVPWKYAIKSIKSVTRIQFTDQRPKTFWEIAQPGQCNFNCNVGQDYPNSPIAQDREILLGTENWQPTQLYNGYGEEVASLYV